MNRTRPAEQPSIKQPDTGEAPAVSPPGASPGLSILHVYSGNLYSGVETTLSTFSLSHRLAPSMRMEYALCFPGRLYDRPRAADAIVHDLGSVRFRSPWSVVRARCRLARLLDRKPFDFVFTHS